MLYTFRGHIAEIVCLSFDPMSTHLVTGSMDKTSILWNVETGQAVMQIDVKQNSKFYRVIPAKSFQSVLILMVIKFSQDHSITQQK